MERKGGDGLTNGCVLDIKKFNEQQFFICLEENVVIMLLSLRCIVVVFMN